MAENYEIQLGSKKTVDSINVDEFFYQNFSTEQTELLPYDQSSVINVAQLFDDERQASQAYRFYGTINFMSIVNGLIKNYDNIFDFFQRPRIGQEASGITRNILNCFDVYLCRPLGNTFSTGGTVLVSGNTLVSGATYELKYQIITNLTDFEIYKSGFGKNIFNDQQFSFDFAKEFDITNQTDSFNKPLTTFYLFFNFKPQLNLHNKLETVSGNTSIDGTINSGKATRPYVVYTGGSIVNGDWVFYLPENFEEIQTLRKEYYVTFYCSGGTGAGLQFKYNPFVPIKLRNFGNDFITGNISGTSEIDHQIPSYAVKIDDNGNYLWKDLLQNGYIDPLSQLGVNYPFINKRHYIFTNMVLKLVTELNDPATATVFSTIKFGPNGMLYSKPTSDLNNLGNKC